MAALCRVNTDRLPLLAPLLHQAILVSHRRRPRQASKSWLTKKKRKIKARGKFTTRQHSAGQLRFRALVMVGTHQVQQTWQRYKRIALLDVKT